MGGGSEGVAERRGWGGGEWVGAGATGGGGVWEVGVGAGARGGVWGLGLVTSLSVSWISISHSGQPTKSLKTILLQQPCHFLFRAAAASTGGFSMALCAAVATAPRIT